MTNRSAAWKEKICGGGPQGPILTQRWLAIGLMKRAHLSMAVSRIVLRPDRLSSGTIRRLCGRIRDPSVVLSRPMARRTTSFAATRHRAMSSEKIPTDYIEEISLVG